jgi:hypothetical protein
MSDAVEPVEPMTELAEGAAQQHELFTAYVNAGFTRPEALGIVIAIITSHLRAQQ